MHSASADTFGYASHKVFGRRLSFAFDARSTSRGDADFTARISRPRLTVALSPLGLLASAIAPDPGSGEPVG